MRWFGVRILVAAPHTSGIAQLVEQTTDNRWVASSSLAAGTISSGYAMYRDAVKYKDTWLAPGSEAMELFKAKKFELLDKHLKALDEAFRKLSGLK